MDNNNTKHTELVPLTAVSERVDGFHQSIELIPDDANSRFVIAGVDDTIENLSKLSQELASQPYVDEEDRKSLVKLRAQMNKFTAAIKSEIKDRQKLLFDMANEDLRRLNSAVSSFIGDLQVMIDDCDARYREEKLASIREEFDKGALYRDFETPLASIFDPKWLNRSTSMKSIIESLDSRLDMITTMINANHTTVDDAIDYLTRNDWRLERALLQYTSDHAPKDEPEEVVDTEIIEEIIKPKKSIRKYIVEVPEGQEDVFTHRMDISGWTYKAL